MKKFLSLSATFLVALICLQAQERVLQTTDFSRNQLLRAKNAAEGRAALGISSTNVTTIGVPDGNTISTNGDGTFGILPGASPALNGSLITNNASWFAENPNSGNPPMRFWESWVLFRGTNLNQSNILWQATNMVQRGYVDRGYNGILIDEPWLSGHNASGEPYASSNRFPNGMKWLVDTIHTVGVPHVGVFASVGDHGVATDPDTGSAVIGHVGYVASDAYFMVTNWGMDFFHLVVDDAGDYHGIAYPRYREFIAAAKSTGKQVQIMGTMHEFEPWLASDLSAGRLWVWPAYVDFQSQWSSVLGFVDNFPTYGWMIKPGSYLEYGWATVAVDYSGALTQLGTESFYSGLAMWSSPIGIVTTYDAAMTPSWLRSIHLNDGMLSIQGDSAAKPPALVATSGNVQVWSKELSGLNRRAIWFLNRATNASGSASITWTNVSLPNGRYSVAEVWSGDNFANSTNSLSASLLAYQSKLFIVAPTNDLVLQQGEKRAVNLNSNLTVEVSGAAQTPTAIFTNSATGSVVLVGSSGLFPFIQFHRAVPDYTRSAIFGTTNTTRINVPNSSSGIFALTWLGSSPSIHSYANGSTYFGLNYGSYGSPGIADVTYIKKLYVGTNGTVIESLPVNSDGTVPIAKLSTNGVTTGAFTNGISGRVPWFTNVSGQTVYILLSTNAP